MKRTFIIPVVVELDDENEDLQGDELELTVEQLHAAFAPHIVSDSVLVGWGLPSITVKLPAYQDVQEVIRDSGEERYIPGINYLGT